MSETFNAHGRISYLTALPVEIRVVHSHQGYVNRRHILRGKSDNRRTTYKCLVLESSRGLIDDGKKCVGNSRPSLPPVLPFGSHSFHEAWRLVRERNDAFKVDKKKQIGNRTGPYESAMRCECE
ncbi:hypothetical protein JHK85_054978 [Glycine max]|nr:hypothetical protein JHK85_054978 [Glycine max]